MVVMVIIVTVIDAARRSVSITDTFVGKQLNRTREHRLIFITLPVRRRSFNKSFIEHDNRG